MIFHKELDLYAFVGLIMLFGVVKKNAIMMIDFAIDSQRQGNSAYDSIWRGCLMRFRPIMMTTVAALFGTLPIALGYGEGADARQPLGPGGGRRAPGESVPDAVHHAGDLPLPGTAAGILPAGEEGTGGRSRGRVVTQPPVIIVTGGARGIGAAAANLAAARGYTVCVNYQHRRDAAEQLVRDITANGGRAIAIQADISSEADVVSLFQQVDATLGKVAALVNNAATLEPQMRLDSMDASRLERIFAVNVLGSMICAREAVRRMSTRHGGTGGGIVNVSSLAAKYGSPGEYVDYAASKGAIETFTVGLAREVAEEGIRVNAVRPGIYLHGDARKRRRAAACRTGKDAGSYAAGRSTRRSRSGDSVAPVAGGVLHHGYDPGRRRRPVGPAGDALSARRRIACSHIRRIRALPG